jgi:uncharacterized membrane protein
LSTINLEGSVPRFPSHAGLCEGLPSRLSPACLPPFIAFAVFSVGILTGYHSVDVDKPKTKLYSTHMKAVTRKIVLLVSISSVIVGCILIVFQTGVIPRDFGAFLSTLINLWPITLVIAGIIFLRDSFLRQRYLLRHAAVEKALAIPTGEHPREINMDVAFSYGNLIVKAGADDTSRLSYKQFGPMPDPVVEISTIGQTVIVKLHKPKPYLSPHFRIRNIWDLTLAGTILHNIVLALHESDLTLDLRRLLIGKLSLKTDSGRHSIFFPKTPDKVEGEIYSASDRLELIIPDESFLRLNLLNPFCRVEFPQGDFEKKEDGSILSAPEKGDFGLIELTVDGPLKQLLIDIE